MGLSAYMKLKKKIEKKCAIEKEPGHKCWSEDEIKQAWGETRKTNIKSSKRKHWSRVIMLQIVKSLVCDTCKLNTAQKNRPATTDEQEVRRNPEDISSQIKAEPETAGAAGGDEQRRTKVSEVSKLSDDSAAASGNQLSASSTEDPSPAEVNSSSRDTKNAAHVNEREETAVKIFEQQKDVDYELCLVDEHDKENIRWERGLQETCGKAQRVKVNSKEKSTQSSDDLKIGAAGGAEQYSAGNQPPYNYCWPTVITSQFSMGTQDPFQFWGQGSASRGQFRTLESEENMYSEDETIYISVPLSRLFGPTPMSHLVPHVPSRYKFINGFPSDNGPYKTSSYAMSFNNDTGNAAWVYEILNRDTLVNNFPERNFGQGYVKGHLAAARDHRWCRKAFNDANVFSNIVPQNSALNNGTWKTLENRCREITYSNGICNVHVYTGPLYLRRVNNVYVPVADTRRMPRLGGKVIPTHLFKVIIEENVDGTVREPECYVMPNEEPESRDVNFYRVNIEFIQGVSGLTFIERRLNTDAYTDTIKSVRLHGEELGQRVHNANIAVRITRVR